MKTHYIYGIKCFINNKMYIGQTINIDKRLYEHFRLTSNECPKLKKAIKKYGKINFYYGIIRECHMQEEANVFERYYIYKFDTISNGYNIQEGGIDGFHSPHSLETKIKISKANKGKKRDKKFCEFLSKIKTGKKRNPHTEETKKKMKEKALNRKPWNTGKKNVYSKEHLDFLRNKMKGNKYRGSAFIFTSPENIKYEVFGECKKFCEKNGLSYAIMITIYIGRRKNKFHKGWTVEKK